VELGASGDNPGGRDRQTPIGDDHRRQGDLGEVEVVTIAPANSPQAPPTKKATVPTTAITVTPQPAIQ